MDERQGGTSFVFIVDKVGGIVGFKLLSKTLNGVLEGANAVQTEQLLKFIGRYEFSFLFV